MQALGEVGLLRALGISARGTQGQRSPPLPRHSPRHRACPYSRSCTHWRWAPDLWEVHPCTSCSASYISFGLKALSHKEGTADGPFSAPLVPAGVMKGMDIYYHTSKTKSQGGFSSRGRRLAGTAGTCLRMELDRVPSPQEQSCRTAAPTSNVHPQNDIPHGVEMLSLAATGCVVSPEPQ